MGACKGFRNGWIQGLSDSRKVFVTIFSSAFSWGLAGRLSKVRKRRPSALHFPANVPEFSLVDLVASPAHSEAIAVARRMCYLTARPGFCVGPWSQVVRPAPLSHMERGQERWDSPWKTGQEEELLERQETSTVDMRQVLYYGGGSRGQGPYQSQGAIWASCLPAQTQRDC